MPTLFSSSMVSKCRWSTCVLSIPVSSVSVKLGRILSTLAAPAVDGTSCKEGLFRGHGAPSVSPTWHLGPRMREHQWLASWEELLASNVVCTSGRCKLPKAVGGLFRSRGCVWVTAHPMMDTRVCETPCVPWEFPLISNLSGGAPSFP